MFARRGTDPRIELKDETAQELMRRAGRVTALTFVKLREMILPGITTAELDALAEKTIRGMGAIPAFLHYGGFPATACISINEVVVHGIPGPAILREGDIVGIDLGSIFDGWYSDATYTYPVGKVSAEAQMLIEIGKGALAAGIAAAQPGKRIRDIGAAVQNFAESRGASVVRDLCGHGVGRNLHEKPEIPNYPTRMGNIEILPGMTLAIEPMLNAGRPEVIMLDDGSFRTLDNSISVHFEHTVLIRADGPEILTVIR